MRQDISRDQAQQYHWRKKTSLRPLTDVYSENKIWKMELFAKIVDN